MGKGKHKTKRVRNQRIHIDKAISATLILICRQPFAERLNIAWVIITGKYANEKE